MKRLVRVRLRGMWSLQCLAAPHRAAPRSPAVPAAGPWVLYRSLQVDLPGGARSGLRHAEKVLTKIEGIEFVYFSHADVVRHPLVQRIVQAYESHESETSRGDI